MMTIRVYRFRPTLEATGSTQPGTFPFSGTQPFHHWRWLSVDPQFFANETNTGALQNFAAKI
jgi:hypothetical protein